LSELANSRDQNLREEEAVARWVQNTFRIRSNFLARTTAGHDLPNMPIRSVSRQQCETQCERDNRCLAVTYNKTHSVCFMKGEASILIRDDNATTSAKEVVVDLHQSPLVFAKNTVIIGNGYSSGPNPIHGLCHGVCYRSALRRFQFRRQQSLHVAG
jgi:hypothetical protein